MRKRGFPPNTWKCNPINTQNSVLSMMYERGIRYGMVYVVPLSGCMLLIKVDRVVKISVGFSREREQPTIGPSAAKCIYVP